MTTMIDRLTPSRQDRGRNQDRGRSGYAARNACAVVKTLISQNVSMPMFAAATALAVFSFAFVALSPSICAARRSAKMASSNTWVRYGTLDESAEHGHLCRASANEVKESIVGLLFFFAVWSIYRCSSSVRVPGQRSDSIAFDARDTL